MQPSVGRIVHYQSYGTPGGEFLPEPRAAIITAVAHTSIGDTDEHQAETPDVSLAVLNPTGLHFNPSVQHSETPKPGHWSWPPRT